jgi:hypothetical protein
VLGGRPPLVVTLDMEPRRPRAKVELTLRDRFAADGAEWSPLHQFGRGAPCMVITPSSLRPGGPSGPSTLRGTPHHQPRALRWSGRSRCGRARNASCREYPTSAAILVSGPGERRRDAVG